MQTAQSPLAQEFNATATEAYKAFPTQLANLVVLLVPDADTPVFISPEVADQLTDSISAVKEAVKELGGELKDNGAVGGATRDYDLGGINVNLIALMDGKNIPDSFTERYTKEMQLFWTLDHEIGHLILRNGFKGVSGNLAESAADAFAMLRHIQRFGKNTDHANYRAERVAGHIVINGETGHYTTNTLARAFAAADEMGDDLSRLSLRETADLAAKIADESHPDDETLERIKKAYQPVAIYAASKLKTNIGLLQMVLRTMKKHREDPAIFNAGKQYLSLPAIKDSIVKGAEKTGYWKRALDLINGTEAPAPQKRRFNIFGARH